MTRREIEINHKALDFCQQSNLHLPPIEAAEEGFKAGAKWEDKHPDISMVSALAYEAGRNDAIEDAVKWIHSALYLDHERNIEHRYATLEELLNDFRKAMEGGEL